MRKLMITAIALLVLVAASATAQTGPAEELTVAKIVEMTQAGLSNETIINAIISSNATFSLSVNDILYLKNEGVSEDVINFMLRTKPLSEYEGEEVGEEVEATDESLPAYVQDATEGNYYDGYEYTDGYDYDDDRYSTIVYHYYGPWFRAYPYYFGFYYYPASYYYYWYWPDDYYYYFYRPRFYSWSYYYHYPRYYSGHYYYYVGGRYVKTSGGRYISRYGNSSTRYAVPRGSASSTISTRSTSDKRKAVTSSSRYRSILYNLGKGRSGSDKRITTGSTSSRKAVIRSGPSTSSRGKISIRSRPSTSSRGKGATVSSRSSGSRSKVSTSSRSRSSSSRGSSSSGKSSGSRTATKKK